MLKFNLNFKQNYILKSIAAEESSELTDNVIWIYNNPKIFYSTSQMVLRNVTFEAYFKVL